MDLTRAKVPGTAIEGACVHRYGIGLLGIEGGNESLMVDSTIPYAPTRSKYLYFVHLFIAPTTRIAPGILPYDQSDWEHGKCCDYELDTPNCYL